MDFECLKQKCVDFIKRRVDDMEYDFTYDIELFYFFEGVSLFYPLSNSELLQIYTEALDEIKACFDDDMPVLAIYLESEIANLS